LQNALNRLSEVGYVRSEASRRGGRERKILRGRAYDRLDELVGALASAVVTARASSEPPVLREHAVRSAAPRASVGTQLGGVDDGAL